MQLGALIGSIFYGKFQNMLGCSKVFIDGDEPERTRGNNSPWVRGLGASKKDGGTARGGGNGDSRRRMGDERLVHERQCYGWGTKIFIIYGGS